MSINDRVNQAIRIAAGRVPAPLVKTGPYATDPTGAPERYVPPTTNAGNGAGMITPVKKVLTPAQQMNNLIRGARR